MRCFSDPCNPTTTVVTTLYDRGLLKRGSLFNHDIMDKIEEWYHEWENELDEKYDKDARFLVRVLTKYTDNEEDKYNTFIHDRDYEEFLEVNKGWIASLPKLRFQRFEDDYYDTDTEFIRVAEDALTSGGKSFLLVRPELKEVFERHCNDQNEMWENILNQNIWRDSMWRPCDISKMSIEHIINCIKWLDSQKVKKFIPSEELRKAFIYKFKSELQARRDQYLRSCQNANSHKDTMKKLTERMRSATPEEQKSVREFMEKTSMKTGLNLNDLAKNVVVFSDDLHLSTINMSYDELVKYNLWRDAEGKVYEISSMRTGHISNCLEMLKNNERNKCMLYSTRDIYIDLFEKELQARQKYKELFPSEEFFRENLEKQEYKEQVTTDNLNKLTPESLMKSNTIGYTLNKLIKPDMIKDKKDSNSENKRDMVNHPQHYSNKKYEPIAVINDWKLSYNSGNCLKYLSRLGLKDDIKQDINKAIFYLIYEGKELGLTKEQILKTVESVFEKR